MRELHRAATSLFVALYNFTRRHSSLEVLTPAQTAGLETHRWSSEEVVEMSDRYWAPRQEAEKAAKAIARRAAEGRCLPKLSVTV